MNTDTIDQLIRYTATRLSYEELPEIVIKKLQDQGLNDGEVFLVMSAGKLLLKARG